MQEVVTMCHEMCHDETTCRKIVENFRKVLQSVANCRKLPGVLIYIDIL